MICENCYGKGRRGSVEWKGVRSCPECQGSGIVSCCDTAAASNPASPYWQPGRSGDGILRKIEPNDTLPGVWAGNKP